MTLNFVAQIFLAGATPNAQCRQNLAPPFTKILDPHLKKTASVVMSSSLRRVM